MLVGRINLSLGERSRCLDTRPLSTGVRRTKRLSPKSPKLPAAPRTERLTRKLSPAWKSSFRYGSKPLKNSAAPSPPHTAALPSLKSQRPHPLKYQMPKGAPPNSKACPHPPPPIKIVVRKDKVINFICKNKKAGPKNKKFEEGQTGLAKHLV